MDEVWIRVILIIFGSTMGSTGMWSFLRSRDVKRTATTQLMMGMAKETIKTHGLEYIERGWVTNEEYEELNTYFFKPYKALGGNGTTERIMEEVHRLPFRSQSMLTGISRNRETEGWNHNVRVVTRQEADSSPG